MGWGATKRERIQGVEVLTISTSSEESSSSESNNSLFSCSFFFVKRGVDVADWVFRLDVDGFKKWEEEDARESLERGGGRSSKASPEALKSSLGTGFFF